MIDRTIPFTLIFLPGIQRARGCVHNQEALDKYKKTRHYILRTLVELTALMCLVNPPGWLCCALVRRRLRNRTKSQCCIWTNCARYSNVVIIIIASSAVAATRETDRKWPLTLYWFVDWFKTDECAVFCSDRIKQWGKWPFCGVSIFIIANDEVSSLCFWNYSTFCQNNSNKKGLRSKTT